jgi:hypothetical protein
VLVIYMVVNFVCVALTQGIALYSAFNNNTPFSWSVVMVMKCSLVLSK